MNACRDNGRAGQEHHHPSPRRRPPRSFRDGGPGRSIACKGPPKSIWWFLRDSLPSPQRSREPAAVSAWHPLGHREVPSAMKDAWWWHEGYAHTYVTFQKLSRPHAGPLNIYDPKNWPLMISWMSLVGPKFDWWPLR